MKTFTAFSAALALLLASTIAGHAQTGPAQSAAAQSAAAQPPVAKTIGQPQQPKVVPSMIVLNARSATLGNGKLVLDGVSSNAIIFADRPVRSAGHALTAHLLEEWSDKSPDSFAKYPPNATVSVFSKSRKGVVDAVVVLKSPKLDGHRLTFDVDLLEGDLVGGDGAVSVFMDIINLPMARRTSHRSAWYAGAP
jgi:hypothetical protein